MSPDFQMKINHDIQLFVLISLLEKIWKHLYTMVLGV